MPQILKVGTSYLLHRETSRSLKVILIVSWPVKRNGKTRRRYLFSLGKRAAAKHGKKSRPKLQTGRTYILERSLSPALRLRLDREKPGWNGERILWFTRMKAGTGS